VSEEGAVVVALAGAQAKCATKGNEQVAKAEKQERKPIQSSSESPEHHARGAVGWARHWKTWPENGDSEAAYKAALRAAKADPEIERFDLAKVAVAAARHPNVVWVPLSLWLKGKA
jgi:hypothetical protein